jgi:hypothetical protein
MVLNRGLITPFRLSMAVKAMGGEMTPKESAEFLVKAGWQEATQGWIRRES